MTKGDLHLRSFSSDGPWVVEPDELTWRRGLDRVRRATQAEAPRLTRRRLLPPGLRVLRTGRLLGTTPTSRSDASRSASASRTSAPVASAEPPWSAR